MTIRFRAAACTWGSAALVVLFLFASGGRGQDLAFGVGVPGESMPTQHRLAAADKLAAAGQWAEAVEEYRHILEESGDDLVPLDATRRSYMPARWLCDARLCALPATALKSYRNRVDQEAARLLTEGEADRDARVLRRLVDRALCSRSGDRALDLLGDLAFERSDFREAERWWRMVAHPVWETAAHGPAAPDGLRAIAFPDPQVDVARVQAKQLLAELFDGDTEDFSRRLAALTAAYPKASGNFAGKQGSYAATLGELARDHAALPPAVEPWWTFAATPSRNAVVTEAPRRLLWRAPLGPAPWPQLLADFAGRDRALRNQGEPPSGLQKRQPPFHPVIVGDDVLVADPSGVTAFHLRDGTRTVWFHLLMEQEGDRPVSLLEISPTPQLDHTLSADGTHVFARFGGERVAPRSRDGSVADDSSFLVCLNVKPDASGNRRRWLVTATAAATKEAPVFFEGAPLVERGRVYAALTRFSGVTATTAIACFDADTGAPLWRQPVDICAVRGAGNESRFRHHLLTLAGPYLVYASHAGAIVAIEAESGRRAWAVRYPSRGAAMPDGGPPPRELAPPMYAAGRLFVAPADYAQILCLNAEDGSLLWEAQPPFEVVNLLGSAADKLIFTTTHDIRALDVITGQLLRNWTQPNDGTSKLPPSGRGFLAGGLVFWSTAEGLRVLHVDDGTPAEEWYPFMLGSLPLGNLALANGCLVAVSNQEIRVYAPEELGLSSQAPSAAAK